MSEIVVGSPKGFAVGKSTTGGKETLRRSDAAPQIAAVGSEFGQPLRCQQNCLKRMRILVDRMRRKSEELTSLAQHHLISKRSLS